MPTPISKLEGLIQVRLKVIEKVGKRNNRTLYKCLCYCGNYCYYEASEIKHKRWPRKSCGQCKDAERYHREYHIWEGIRDRCNNSNRISYKNYGGRGIKVCSRWSDFLFFLEDLGFMPDGEYSIERKNVNGNYEPNNCIWMLSTFQNLNKRKL